MASHLIKTFDDLRQIMSETDESWAARKQVARDVLKVRRQRPEFKFKFYQNKGVDCGRIPDFTIYCIDCDARWAIEIGITGNARVDELEGDGFTVVRVRRGCQSKIALHLESHDCFDW